MGIKNLLPQLRDITQSIHVDQYAGQKVAIDGYSWLHKVAIPCSQELCRGEPTDVFVRLFMQRLGALQRHGVEPIVVFDGGHLPMKSGEEEDRRRARREKLAKAEEWYQQGLTQAARDAYMGALDVSPRMVKTLIQILQRSNIDYLVAPYEADAQLAFLAREGYVHAVISEDSDMLVYGCPRVLFKWDHRTGLGQEVMIDNLAHNRKPSFKGWNHDMFIQMCILMGCDFLKSPKGVGDKKAHQMMQRLRNFTKICSNMRRFERTICFPDNYERRFQRAIWTFKHQRVYCPKRKQLVHLQALPPGGLADGVEVLAALPRPEEADLVFLGRPLPDHVAQGIATGHLDPFTYEPLLPLPLPDLAARYSGSARVTGAAASGKSQGCEEHAQHMRPSAAATDTDVRCHTGPPLLPTSQQTQAASAEGASQPCSQAVGLFSQPLTQGGCSTQCIQAGGALTALHALTQSSQLVQTAAVPAPAAKKDDAAEGALEVLSLDKENAGTAVTSSKISGSKHTMNLAVHPVDPPQVLHPLAINMNLGRPTHGRTATGGPARPIRSRTLSHFFSSRPSSVDNAAHTAPHSQQGSAAAGSGSVGALLVLQGGETAFATTAADRAACPSTSQGLHCSVTDATAGSVAMAVLPGLPGLPSGLSSMTGPPVDGGAQGGTQGSLDRLQQLLGRCPQQQQGQEEVSHTGTDAQPCLQQRSSPGNMQPGHVPAQAANGESLSQNNTAAEAALGAVVEVACSAAQPTLSVGTGSEGDADTNTHNYPSTRVLPCKPNAVQPCSLDPTQPAASVHKNSIFGLQHLQAFRLHAKQAVKSRLAGLKESGLSRFKEAGLSGLQKPGLSGRAAKQVGDDDVASHMDHLGRDTRLPGASATVAAEGPASAGVAEPAQCSEVVDMIAEEECTSPMQRGCPGPSTGHDQAVGGVWNRQDDATCAASPAAATAAPAAGMLLSHSSASHDTRKRKLPGGQVGRVGPGKCSRGGLSGLRKQFQPPRQLTLGFQRDTSSASPHAHVFDGFALPRTLAKTRRHKR